VREGRISPVLDASRTLLVMEIANGKILARQECEIEGEELSLKASRLAGLGIRTLICGAVSRPLAELVASRGIRLVSFVAGRVEEVLAAFVNGVLPNPALTMPGCCRWRAGFGGGRTGGRGCRRRRIGR
jgi:predicted Fe-Mo cluster-binding NifX family protein